MFPAQDSGLTLLLHQLMWMSSVESSKRNLAPWILHTLTWILYLTRHLFWCAPGTWRGYIWGLNLKSRDIRQRATGCHCFILRCWTHALSVAAVPFDSLWAYLSLYFPIRSYLVSFLWCKYSSSFTLSAANLQYNPSHTGRLIKAAECAVFLKTRRTLKHAQSLTYPRK